MRFHVNPGDELPLYRQIMRQVIDAVAGAQLRPGDKLPSHRELSQVQRLLDEEGARLERVRGNGTTQKRSK